MNDPKKLVYGVKDVAQALSVSRSSVYNLQRDGVLPAPVKLGARTLWPAQAVEEAAARILSGSVSKRA